jgi:hypothetical protein
VIVSQNGWKAVPDTSTLVRFKAAGGGFWAANEDVATIGQYLIERFNRDVEPIAGRVLDDWSYANRLVRGSTDTVSNHGSATAWDLNALQHPRGVRGTFTAAQLRAIRGILHDITDDDGQPVVRWGGTYTTTVDDMHFEINAGPRRVRQAAEKVRDIVRPDDIRAIAAEVRDLLVKDGLVINRRLAADDPKQEPFTIAGALSNIEFNQDQEIARAARDRAAVDALRLEVKGLRAEIAGKSVP